MAEKRVESCRSTSESRSSPCGCERSRTWRMVDMIDHQKYRSSLNRFDIFVLTCSCET